MYKLGEIRTSKHFAFLPTKMSDGKYAFFTYYTIVEEYQVVREYGFDAWYTPIVVHFTDWVITDIFKNGR